MESVGNSGLLTIRISIADEEQLFLLDTGACKSLISERIAKAPFDPTDINLSSASGHALPVKGVKTTKFKISNKEYEHLFFVAEKHSIPVAGILGMDYLSTVDCTIRTKKNHPVKITIEGQKLTVNQSRNNSINVTNYLEVFKEWRFNTNSHGSEDDAANCNTNTINELPTPQTRNWDTAIRASCFLKNNNEINANEAGFFQLYLKGPEGKFKPGTEVFYDPFLNCVGKHTQSCITKVLGTDKEPFIQIPFISFRTDTVQIKNNKKLGLAYEIERDSSFEPILFNAPTKLIDRSPKERITELHKIVDKMFKPGTKENKFMKTQVNDMPSIFGLDDEPLNISPMFVYKIKLTSEDPVYRKAYPVPIKFQEQLEQQIEEMLLQGIIEQSASAFNAPLVPVVKSDGKLRVTVDYRHLNTVVHDERYVIPSISDMFSTMQDSKFFSNLDIRQAFWQIKLDEESKQYTAFSTPRGKYHFNSLPMGLKCSSGAFQRIIDSVLYGLTGRVCKIFIDDVLILGKTFAEHCENLVKVFKRLHEAKLTIRLSKCKFFQKEIRFLGHIVSDKGIRTQPEKVAAIKNMSRPKNVKELLRFLGAAGYYRKHFPGDFAEITFPLTELTKGATRKACRNQRIQWSDEAQKAFEKVKELLCKDIMLMYPNFSKPFYLHTDASDVSVGGMLSQENEHGERQPLMYFSKKLSKAQRNYSTTEKEAMSLVYGLRQCKQITLGYDTIVASDHQCLRKIFSTGKPVARLTRWQMELMSYPNVHVTYVPGKQNTLADFLSRLKNDKKSKESCEESTGSMSDEEDELSMNAVPRSYSGVLSVGDNNEQPSNANHEPSRLDANSSQTTDRVIISGTPSRRRIVMAAGGSSDDAAITVRGGSENAEDSACGSHEGSNEELIEVNEVPINIQKNVTRNKEKEDEHGFHWDLDTYKKYQDKDEVCSLLKEYVKGTLSKIKRKKLRKYIPNFMSNHYNIFNGLLYKIHIDVEYKPQTMLIYVPVEMRRYVLEWAHNTKLAGHRGLHKTIERLRTVAFWPGSAADIKNYIRTCTTCCRFKPSYDKHAPILRFNNATRAFERVHIDLVMLERSKTGHRYILTAIDAMTHYLIAVPLRTKTTQEVAAALIQHVVLPFGVMDKVISDNGPEFLSEVFKSIMQDQQIEHRTVAIYTPKTNGLCERVNKSLVSILICLVNDNPKTWTDMLPSAVAAYNGSYSESLRENPQFLMFLRDLKRPIDVFLPSNIKDVGIQEFKTIMMEIQRKAFKRVIEELTKGYEQREAQHKACKIKELQIGDRVYIKNPPKPGPRKLQLKYRGPMRVIERLGKTVVIVQGIQSRRRYKVHTDNIKVVPEDALTIEDHPNIRKPYPEVGDDVLTDLEEFHESTEVETEEDEIETQETLQREMPLLCPRPDRQLRSAGAVKEIDNVMLKPIEYKAKGRK